MTKPSKNGFLLLDLLIAISLFTLLLTTLTACILLTTKKVRQTLFRFQTLETAASELDRWLATGETSTEITLETPTPLLQKATRPLAANRKLEVLRPLTPP